MSDSMNKNVEDALEDLFSESSNLESLEVTLPSLAKGYKKTKKVVRIRPMTYDDEKYIASHSGENILDDILTRCVSDVLLDELYLEDKLFLYYKIRESSFGSISKISTSCVKCGTINDLEIDLSQLQIDYASETFENPKKVFLPNLKKDAFVMKVQVNTQEYSKTNDKLLTNLWRYISKIGDCDDPVVIAQAVKKLSSADIRTIMKSINESDFGIDSRARYVCNKCNSENVASVGLSLDFFSMS